MKCKRLAIGLLIIPLFFGCKKESLADVLVNEVGFNQVSQLKVLNLPNGVYRPDNPYFNVSNSDTWTGNMAQYVHYIYTYSVAFEIENRGESAAYASEVILYYLFDDGEESVESIFIGDIGSRERFRSSTQVITSNRQLIDCRCEVYWYD